MKIITLNTWGGQAGQDLIMSFFDKYRDTDIFCLQEIWKSKYPKEFSDLDIGSQKIDYGALITNLHDLIIEKLPEHNHHFHPAIFDVYGLMILVRDNFLIKEFGEKFVFGEKEIVPLENMGNHARNIQYIKTEIKGKETTIINFHGLWNGKGKTDTADRILQSQNVVDFIKTLSGEVVLCGDFNLNPDTQSLKMFEDIGLINLIKENNVTSTRTSFYEKENRFADYVFVSKGIKVISFEVLPDEVSDHSAIAFEID